MIDITGIDLVKFAQKVYELSAPQGLGFLHYTPEPLTEEEAKKCTYLDREPPYAHGSGVVLDMDYVKGRACKMVVWQKDGKLKIREPWYDHTDGIFKELLNTFNIQVPAETEHGIACGCMDCLSARGQETEKNA